MSHAIQPGTLVVAAPFAPATQSRALTTRFLDFWLLGGASLLVWFVMWVLEDYRAAWAIDSQFKNLAVTTVSLSLLVNHPHFLISYKLAYSRGGRFVLAHWWQLLAVPALLVALFAAAFVGFTTPTADVLPFVPTLAGTLGAWGADTAAFTTERLGDFLFTLAFNVMFFTVGWHYTKQAFGCMMLYAHLDGYQLTPRQRGLIKWNLLAVSWVNLAYGSQHSGPLTFSHFTYYSVDLPDVLVPLSGCVLAAGLVLLDLRLDDGLVLVLGALLVLARQLELHVEEFLLLLLPRNACDELGVASPCGREREEPAGNEPGERVGPLLVPLESRHLRISVSSPQASSVRVQVARGHSFAELQTLIQPFHSITYFTFSPRRRTGNGTEHPSTGSSKRGCSSAKAAASV